MKNMLHDLALLWLRVTVGCGLIIHGWMKLTGGVDKFAAGAVTEMGFPLPLLFAWLAVAAEIAGGFFLILGLWPRVTAAVLTLQMAVAAFIRMAPDPWIAPGGKSKELALAYLVIVAAILLLGAGRYAVHGGGRSKATAPKKSKR